MKIEKLTQYCHWAWQTALRNTYILPSYSGCDQVWLFLFITNLQSLFMNLYMEMFGHLHLRGMVTWDAVTLSCLILFAREMLVSIKQVFSLCLTIREHNALRRRQSYVWVWKRFCRLCSAFTNQPPWTLQVFDCWGKGYGEKGKSFLQSCLSGALWGSSRQLPHDYIYIYVYIFSLFYNSYCTGYQQSEGGRAVTTVCWGRNFPVLQRDSQAKDDLRTCSNWGLPETLLCLGHVSFFSRANY